MAPRLLPAGPLPSESRLGLPPQPSLSSFSSNHFHISPAVIIKYFLSDLTFTEAAATGNSGTAYFLSAEPGGCELGVSMVFNVIAVKEGKEKKKRKREGKSGREGKGRGLPEGAQPGGRRRGSSPAGRGRASPAPSPAGAVRRPRNFPPAPAATFPAPGSCPIPLRAPPGRGTRWKTPERDRTPHPHPAPFPETPAPTSARKRATASRAQSSGRVFHICKRGSGAGAVSAGRAGASGAAAAAAAKLPARRPRSP